uniref:Ig-like domain-containing protein n=1 Tax=Salmo trutta TaxID=8032 RepID=A0A674F2C1_SALTR
MYFFPFLFSNFIELFPPAFITKPDPLTLYVGKKANIQCVVTGSSPMTIVWHKDNNAISSGGNYKISSEKNKYILEISELELTDQGVYLCKAFNSVGTAVCSTEMKVINKPHFVKTLESVSVAVGNPLVGILAKPLPTIEWYKDGKEMVSSTTLSIESTTDSSSLLIKDATRSHTGTYEIKIKNALGSASTFPKMINLTCILSLLL